MSQFLVLRNWRHYVFIHCNQLTLNQRRLTNRRSATLTLSATDCTRHVSNGTGSLKYSVGETVTEGNDGVMLAGRTVREQPYRLHSRHAFWPWRNSDVKCFAGHDSNTGWHWLRAISTSTDCRVPISSGITAEFPHCIWWTTEDRTVLCHFISLLVFSLSEVRTFSSASCSRIHPIYFSLLEQEPNFTSTQNNWQKL
jgi:hypothetical protein